MSDAKSSTTRSGSARANELGLSPSDERREEFYDQEWERLMAASEADFEEAVREDEAWEAGAKWDDSQYVRDYLLYARIETERQARADQAGDESDDPAPRVSLERNALACGAEDAVGGICKTVVVTVRHPLEIAGQTVNAIADSILGGQGVATSECGVCRVVGNVPGK